MTQTTRKRTPYLGLPVTEEQLRAWEDYRRVRATTTTRLLEEAVSEYFSRRQMAWPHHPSRIA